VTRNGERVTCHLPGLDPRIVVPALAADANIKFGMAAMNWQFHALRWGRTEHEQQSRRDAAVRLAPPLAPLLPTSRHGLTCLWATLWTNAARDR
jgi:hypothetical protein